MKAKPGLPSKFKTALRAMQDQAMAVETVDRDLLRDAQSRMHSVDEECRVISRLAIRRGLEIPTVTESELSTALGTF